MADIQSNLANLLNDVTFKGAKALQWAGDLIGTVADAAGAVGGAISVLEQIGVITDQTQAELQAIIDAITTDFQQLNEDLKAEHIIERTTNLSNQLSPGQAVMASLREFLNQQPPLTAYDRSQQIEICITALQALGAESAWEAPYNDQVFWTDEGANVWANKLGSLIDRGYGDQSPQADSTGAVFNYTYVLPVYMQAILIFLTAGGSLDPDFLANYGDSVVRPASVALQTYHDRILTQGLTKLSPAPWDGSMLVDAVLDDPTSPSKTNPVGLSPLAEQTLVPFTPPNWIPEALGGVSIEYGAVERFSGGSALGTYVLTLPLAPGPAPFNKFKLRVLNKAKDLYISVGLNEVWTTVNRLKSLAGDPPLPPPCFADWSIRNEVIPTAEIGLPTPGYYSLRSILSFIQTTAPTDVPLAPTLSLRALLTA